MQRWGLLEVIHGGYRAVGWWRVAGDGGASSGILAGLPPGMYDFISALCWPTSSAFPLIL